MSLGFFVGGSLALQSLYTSVLLESEAEDAGPVPESADWERRRVEFLKVRMSLGFDCLALQSWAPLPPVCFSSSLFLSSSRLSSKNSSKKTTSFSVTSLRPFSSFPAVLVARKVL